MSKILAISTTDNITWEVNLNYNYNHGEERAYDGSYRCCNARQLKDGSILIIDYTMGRGSTYRYYPSGIIRIIYEK